jgi:hypothetical protein
MYIVIVFPTVIVSAPSNFRPLVLAFAEFDTREPLRLRDFISTPGALLRRSLPGYLLHCDLDPNDCCSSGFAPRAVSSQPWTPDLDTPAFTSSRLQHLWNDLVRCCNTLLRNNYI